MYTNKDYQLAFEEFKKFIKNDEWKEFLDEMNEISAVPVKLSEKFTFYQNFFEIAENLWFKEEWKAYEVSYIESKIIYISIDLSEYIADYIAFYSVSEQLMNMKEELMFYTSLYERLWFDFVIVINESKVYLMFWDDFIINQVMWNFVNGVSYIKYSDYLNKFLEFEYEWEKGEKRKVFTKENVDFFIDLSKYDFEKVSIELKKWKVKFLEWEESLQPVEKWKEMEQEDWFDYGDIRKVKCKWRYVWIKREIKKKYK